MKKHKRKFKQPPKENPNQELDDLKEMGRTLKKMVAFCYQRMVEASNERRAVCEAYRGVSVEVLQKKYNLSEDFLPLLHEPDPEKRKLIKELTKRWRDITQDALRMTHMQLRYLQFVIKSKAKGDIPDPYEFRDEIEEAAADAAYREFKEKCKLLESIGQ